MCEMVWHANGNVRESMMDEGRGSVEHTAMRAEAPGSSM